MHPDTWTPAGGAGTGPGPSKIDLVGAVERALASLGEAIASSTCVGRPREGLGAFDKVP
jgi:hypothetical protein